MDKTILNQRVRVTEYHYEDYDGNWEEGGHILLDTATGSVCVETNGDPLFFDSMKCWSPTVAWRRLFWGKKCGWSST